MKQFILLLSYDQSDNIHLCCQSEDASIGTDVAGSS